MADQYSAVWISHSSIGDYLKCPRLYYLRNMYRDPKTGHKFTIMTPPLALGQAVHDVIESIATLPVEQRLIQPLSQRLDQAWKAVSGQLGGFTNPDQENEYKNRALKMMQVITDNPGPISKMAVKIPMDLPHYWLSEDEGIILCGKIDWLEHIEKNDSVKIYDFKTGRNEEDSASLQLPIYTLLLKNCQKRQCEGACYWYLDRDGQMVDVDLPSLEDSYNRVYEIGKKIVLARKLDHLKCKTQGCNFCTPFEKVIKGEGKLVGLSNYKQDIYIL